jgi:MscS family membrane protein
MRALPAQAVLALALCSPGWGQLGTPPAEQKKPEENSDRLTPQRSVLSFLSAVRAKDYDRAIEYLNVDKIPRQEQSRRGWTAAKTLAQVLDGAPDFQIGSLSNEPEGNQEDDLPEDRELLYTATDRKIRIEMERRPRGPDGVLVWGFTSDTVSRIASAAQDTFESGFEKHLPAWIVRWTFLETPLWRWVALLAALLLAIPVSRRLALAALRILQPVCHHLDPMGVCNIAALFTSPLRLLLTVILFRVFAAWLPLSALGRFYLDRGVDLATVLAIAWIMARVVDVFAARYQLSLAAKHTSLSRSVLPLLSRVGKGLILILAVTLTLTNWGFDMTAALAGVGIGGIAIALAAQKTIENLFGGFAIITDGPVAVGDFCKFGERAGTVEDIGLRSTRVRTLDRTVVTVPNGEFSSMVLENYSRRDKVWFHPTLNIRKDATAAQLRQIMRAIEEILKRHPKVEPGGLPVRFLGVGSYSLDIEIFAYVSTADYNEFLKIQQELLLPVLDAVAAAGTALALPAQAELAAGNRSEPGIPNGHPARPAEKVPGG